MAVTKVLPTPPLPLVTAMTLLLPSNCGVPDWDDGGALDGKDAAEAKAVAAGAKFIQQLVWVRLVLPEKREN